MEISGGGRGGEVREMILTDNVQSILDINGEMVHIGFCIWVCGAQNGFGGLDDADFGRMEDAQGDSGLCTEGRRQIRGAFQPSFFLVISQLLSIMEQKYFAYL